MLSFELDTVQLSLPKGTPMPNPALAAVPSLLLSMTVLVGCATTHGTRAVGPLTIHTFRRDWTNVHAIVGPDGAFLVDAGFAENAEALEEDLRASGIDPAALRAIVLTHGHADHAGGALHFRSRFGTPILAGRGDEALLQEGHNDTLCPTNDDAVGRLESDQSARFAGFAPDRVIDTETDLAALTGVPGRIVPLPGHTPGSLVVVVAGAALVGDLFRGTVFTEGAEVHFYMCDLEDNRADVRTLLGTVAPDASSFFVGHFGPLRRAAVEERFPAVNPAVER